MAKNWYKLYVIMSWAHKNTFSWHMFLPPTRTFFVLLSKLFCRLMLKNLTHITSNVCRLWMTKSSSRSHRQQTSISIKCWNNAIELYRQSPFISLTHEKQTTLSSESVVKRRKENISTLLCVCIEFLSLQKKFCTMFWCHSNLNTDFDLDQRVHLQKAWLLHRNP